MPIFLGDGIIASFGSGSRDDHVNSQPAYIALGRLPRAAISAVEFIARGFSIVDVGRHSGKGTGKGFCSLYFFGSGFAFPELPAAAFKAFRKDGNPQYLSSS